MAFDITRLLRATVQFKASDLHLQTGSPPTLRIDGSLSPLDMPKLSDVDLLDSVRQLGGEQVLQAVQTQRSADLSYTVEGLARFRVNAFFQQDSLAIVLRAIPLQVPSLETLHLPPVVKEIALAERGLILVTGTTGSGKSTTLASIIDFLNRSHRIRIVTIEDPIEFVHVSHKSLIAQRELGVDTKSFADSLRSALRQDPDFILVGELRDVETMRTAMQAADTGHTVFSTLHTTNATHTVQRLVSMFPTGEREWVLMQLAANLHAVISQRLAKARDGGRVPAVEIMQATPTIRKLISEGKISLLSQAIANRDAGMQLFDQHLADLYNSETISGTEALRLATNPEAVGMAMRGIGRGDMSSGLVS
jgi:twitching motility protein PilT